MEKLSEQSKRKLFFGCGENSDLRSEGYENVDIQQFPQVDHCIDISKRLPFKDETIDEIYAEHVLEHIGHMLPTYDYDGIVLLNTIRVLTEWKRVLKVGGLLRINVPNIECQMYKYSKGEDTLKSMILWIWGGTRHADNEHKIGFDLDLMTECLTEAGFTNLDFRNGQNYNEKFNRIGNDEMFVSAVKC